MTYSHEVEHMCCKKGPNHDRLSIPRKKANGQKSKEIVGNISRFNTWL